MKTIIKILKLNNVRKILSNKKNVLSILFVALFFGGSVFASTNTGIDFGANTVMEVILKFITSRWVIGLVIALLAFEIILFITAGRSDNQAWKKFVPIILGTGLFLAAPKIADYFINDSKLTTTQQNALNLLEGKSLSGDSK